MGFAKKSKCEENGFTLNTCGSNGGEKPPMPLTLGGKMNITIRLAVPSDAPDMAEVGMRSWEAAYKHILPADYIREKNATRPQQFRESITDENTTAYVIQKDGKTAGIMKLAPPADDDVDDTFYEMHYIYLHPDYFRQGIGAQAMKFAFQKARELGKTFMVIWVFAENTNTIEFYKKCGFIADNKSRTQSRGRDVVIIRMRKTL